MELIRDEVNATLVSLQVVQAEQKIHFVIFQDCERTHKDFAHDLQIGSIHSA